MLGPQFQKVLFLMLIRWNSSMKRMLGQAVCGKANILYEVVFSPHKPHKFFLGEIVNHV